MKVVHNIDAKGRKKGCPTRSNCNTCNWYRPLYNEKPGGEIEQVFDCQQNNIALLLSEQKARMVGVQHAIESARNETIKRQDALLNNLEGDYASLPRQ